MTESINSYHSLETEFAKLNLERKINYEVEEIDLTETNDFDPDITLDGSENLFPPPYNHSMSRNPHSDNPNMNMMLYEKMLNLECLVSNIHETVVDSPLLNSDVSQQLKEINDTMNRFQKEASVRLRQKLSVKPDCQTIFNDDGSQPQKTPTIGTEEDCFPVEDSQRYDRVCSMVESLISDANTVLSSRGAPSKELFQKQLENDLDELGPLMKSSTDKVHKSEEMAHQRSEPVVPCTESQPIETPDNNDDSLVLEFSLNFNRSGKSNTRSMKKKLTLPLFRQSSLNSSNKSIANGASKQSSETALIDPTLVSFSNYGTVGLLVLLGYWTFLFTLGTVLLDSSLCDMAGLHVMELVDAISGSQVKRVGQRRLGSKKSFPRIEYQIPTAPPKHRRSSF